MGARGPKPTVLPAMVQDIVDKLADAFPFGPVQPGYRQGAHELIVNALKPLCKRLNIRVAAIYHVRDSNPREFLPGRGYAGRTDRAAVKKDRMRRFPPVWHLWNGYVDENKRIPSLCGKEFPANRMERWPANSKHAPVGQVCKLCVKSAHKRYGDEFQIGIGTDGHDTEE